MEESGENWPSDSYMKEVDDELCFDDDEEDEEGDPMMGNTDRKKRERELTERFLALSATIPGFKKQRDEISILANASTYVKQLEKRVRELEQQVESNVVCSNEGGSSRSCEVNSNEYDSGRPNKIFEEVKVRVLEKDVLIIIHCEKQKGIMLKILSHLENLNLSVVNSSVLRFGKSNLDITIVAQMGDGYKMTVDELVKNLRVAIFSTH